MATSFEQEKKDFGAQAASIGDKAKEMAAEAGSKVKDVASAVGQKVGEAASFVGKKVDDASSALGCGIKSLGGTIREHTPDKGMVGDASSAVADTLEGGGRYLQEHGISGVGADVTDLIRRNPIPAVCLAIGLGFLLAKITSRSQ
jgi:phage-related protein